MQDEGFAAFLFSYALSTVFIACFYAIEEHNWSAILSFIKLRMMLSSGGAEHYCSIVRLT